MIYPPLSSNKYTIWQAFSLFFNQICKATVPPHNLCYSVPGAVKNSSSLVTVQQTLATVKETSSTLGHRLWSLLPHWKCWAAQNIASGEEGAIFHSGKVHHRSCNAQSKFGTARRKFVWRFGPLGQRRNLERWTTATSPAVPGWWLNVAQSLMKRL